MRASFACLLACSAGSLGGMSAVVGKAAGSLPSEQVFFKTAMYLIMVCCNVGDSLNYAASTCLLFLGSPSRFESLSYISRTLRSTCLAPPYQHARHRTAGMMSFHTKAMHSLSSVSATAISTSANILATGAASIIVFGNLPTAGWLLGTVFLIVGTGLITAASVPAFDSDRPQERKAA
jgi:hypothetical protein